MPEQAPHNRLNDIEVVLRDYRFDEENFKALQQHFKRQRDLKHVNRLTRSILPVAETDIHRIDPEEHTVLEHAGMNEITSGRVGVIILAGGMATRFGGGVKALRDVTPGQTFLDTKLDHINALAHQASITFPVFVMTSFASHEPIREYLDSRHYNALKIRLFPQSVSLRLTLEGEVYKDAEGRPSLYTPGHGDVIDAFKRSGLLDSFNDAGGQYIFICNVDNIGANLDASIVGFHARSDTDVTVEVTHRNDDDTGGVPALLDNRPQIIEWMRLPEGTDTRRFKWFNTNSFMVDSSILNGDFPLEWFVVKKTIDGQHVIQFERLLGQITAFASTSFLYVEREGPHSRFVPIKTIHDLERFSQAPASG